MATPTIHHQGKQATLADVVELFVVGSRLLNLLNSRGFSLRQNRRLLKAKAFEESVSFSPGLNELQTAQLLSHSEVTFPSPSTSISGGREVCALSILASFRANPVRVREFPVASFIMREAF